jgi:hypothetical protein
LKIGKTHQTLSLLSLRTMSLSLSMNTIFRIRPSIPIQYDSRMRMDLSGEIWSGTISDYLRVLRWKFLPVLMASGFWMISESCLRGLKELGHLRGTGRQRYLINLRKLESVEMT